MTGALTPRETDVVRLLAGGATAKEISLTLGMAPRTVEKHADTARLRMQAKNRVHLVVLAIRSGAIAMPEAE